MEERTHARELHYQSAYQAFDTLQAAGSPTPREREATESNRSSLRDNRCLAPWTNKLTLNSKTSSKAGLGSPT